MSKKINMPLWWGEAQIEVPDGGFKNNALQLLICKRKGYIIGIAGPNDFNITKGESPQTLSFHSKTAKHYFESLWYSTHNRPRRDPKIYGINIACIEGIKPFDLKIFLYRW